MPTRPNFIEAANQLTLIKLIDYSGNFRIVEPYMIYDSAKGKLCFHFYQIDGYSESRNITGWKNPEVKSFEFSEIIDTLFKQRIEYNPFNEKMFVNVHFSVPTYDGRTRNF
jgi:hypothetical protein